MEPSQFTALEMAMKNMSHMAYDTVIELGASPGDTNTGAIIINRSDFALITLKWAFVTGPDTDAVDANFSIDLSMQNTKRFWKGTIAPMAKTFGTPDNGVWSKYNPPVIIPIQTTVYIELTNHYAAALENDLKIQIILEGDEKVQPL